jgi:hypothetical protein
MAAVLVFAAAPAGAFVLGGGLTDTDCRVAFAGVDPTHEASGVVCADGDPRCDRDGIADGVCRFEVGLCVNAGTEPCETAVVERIDLGGTALPRLDLPAGDGTCGPSATLAVPIGAPSASTLLAYGNGGLRDVDYLGLCCVPAVEGTAAARCALAVDLGVTGCTRLPRRLRRAFARARALVDGGPDGTPSRRQLRRAARLLRRVHTVGKAIAQGDDCGFAVQLLATYTRNRILEAVPSAGPGSRAATR